MHAVLITTNISQHCPDGCNNPTCALEGTLKIMCLSLFHMADELGRPAVAVTSLSVQNETS